MIPAIKTTNLSKRYGNSFALDSLNLEVRPGEALGYLGPNGAGKTTTIRLLLGLIGASSGSAELFGLDSQKHKEEVHSRLAYVPGEATLWPALTGAETLHLLGKVHGKVDAEYRDELIKRFDFEPAKKVRAYSKGNRQKLSLIAAFMTRAELLILDEPTSGLDPLMEQVFQTTVLEAKANKQTIFLSSHILSEVEALCDRVAILRNGKLVEIGTLEQIRHLSAVTVEATFDHVIPDFSETSGVSNVITTANTVRFQVQGSMEAALTALAQGHATKIISREPSLDELFLSIYGSDTPASHAK
jgi:ABC-2 type transport system ATP-binding protein